MRPDIHLNWAAIVGALVGAFVFGSLWYGPLFGRTWARLMGFPADFAPKPGQMRKAMLLQLAGTFLIVFCLTHDLQVWMPETWHLPPDGAPSYAYGFMAAFFTWLGFFLPKELSRLGWEGRSWKLLLINAGHDFLSLLLMGLILARWR